jgi:regulator of protease activity HflC (stomatin/prohibitin superfamily)
VLAPERLKRASAKKGKAMELSLISVAAVLLLLLAGVRIVRPTERGLVERFGRYRRLAVPGFNWIIPFADRMYRINITEMMVDAEPQEIITNDNLNKVVKAENEKVAAIDFATATETMADGARRAEIKKADGVKQGRVLQAEGEAQAIKLIYEASNRYFIGNAQLLKKLETVDKALATNAKVIIPAGSELVNVIGELAGVVPLARTKPESESALAARG